MTWTGQLFSVGQVLTAAQMTNLQADITAAFNGDSGAPVLANQYVVADIFNKASTYSFPIIGSVSTWTMSAGVYVIGKFSSNIKLQMYSGSSWVTVNESGSAMFISDGSNYRVNNTAVFNINISVMKLN